MTDDLDIPESLKLSAEERRAAWDKWVQARTLASLPPYTNPHQRETTASSFEAIDEMRKQEARDRIVRLKASRPGKKWDAKRKEWIDEVQDRVR